jgi:hypothetical protein
MSGNNNNGLAGRPAQMEAHSQSMEITRRFVWKIDNFTWLMIGYSYNTALAEPKQFSIPLPGGEETAVMTIVCTPRKLNQDRYGYSDAESVELTVEFKFSSLISNPVTQVSVGLLDSNRQDIPVRWDGYQAMEAHVYRASRPHNLLRQYAVHSPLPNGQLTIFVKVTIMVWPHEGMAKTGANRQLQAVFRICIPVQLFVNMDPDPALHINAYPD